MTNDSNKIVAATVVACLAFALSRSDLVNAAATSALPGMTYESLRGLPDWSGWWAQRESATAEFQRNPPPMKRPEDLARIEAATLNPAADPDPGRFCRPQQFVGVVSNFAPNVEFLFTLGRVTITNELGLIRRIYTDGTAVPKDPDETDTGTSTGHWEGKTLVVETVGINPKAKFPFALTSGAIPIGKNVKITERISLNGENLDFSVLIFAPDILTAPYQRKFSFRRVAGKHMAQEMPTCKENDRAFDAATGTQRFDMTPPADLPPPPRQ